MPISTPSRLYRNRCGVFCYRLQLPVDLRQYTERREIRLSLRVQQRPAALALSQWLNLRTPALLECLRRQMSENTNSKPGFFKAWIESEKRRFTLMQQLEEHREQALDAELGHRQELTRYKNTAWHITEKAHFKGYKEGSQQAGNSIPLTAATPLFSTLRDAYLKHLNARPRSGQKRRPTEKTLAEYRASLDLFISVMGDLAVGEIDRDRIADYSIVLKRLPANINRKPRYEQKSIEEILALGDPPQSGQNASKQIERLSVVFRWALDEKRKWSIESNPAKGYGRGKTKKTVRLPFTDDELIALLSHPDFKARKFARSYAYWMIPLALFTGARVGELAQLYLSDFVQVEGIPCINITDEQEGQRVKTDSGKRLVPIHSSLIGCGLLREVERLRAKGEEKLFPGLNFNRRDGPGQTVSNWFQRYRKECGITSKQTKVFHSFRHTFITRLLDASVPPHLVAPIVGHEGDLITEKVYWNVRDAVKRKPTVEAFRLPQGITKMIPSVEAVTFSKQRPARKKRAPADAG